MSLVTVEMGFLMVHQLAGEGQIEKSPGSTDHSVRLCRTFLKKRGIQVSFGHHPSHFKDMPEGPFFFVAQCKCANTF